jgi:hypothetical protein
MNASDPSAPPVTDLRIAEMMCSATAECERGKPDSACIVRASELLAMTRELSERRARDVAAVGREAGVTR